ncbi:hypothetical protein CDD82_4095 [Ophiocordyceps australis]|uniref:FAM86 N-terminal domain-containing protein n=1 Tax=Ophiocordyceps australis TaxID=1399860 RepID=A0A2C5ZUF5_9HYPO|nr:hypothetical protein CDD82_4095 [Ophiocordyceps australis]
MHDAESSWIRQVDRLRHQYFQQEAVLDFPSPELIRLPKVQDAIYSQLFDEHAVVLCPPKRYQTKVLKQLVVRIEAAIVDWDTHAVSDSLMTSLAELMRTPMPLEAAVIQEKSTVRYYLSQLDHSGRDLVETEEEPCISLLESRSILSAAGTTGLRTWEAALHLGQYLSQNPQVVAGRRVLELGAGTGYLSMLCAKYLSPAHVTLSDGSDDVVSSFANNLLLNRLQEDSSHITFVKLIWGHPLIGADAQWIKGEPVDVILGADVTYDRSAIPALVATLAEILGMYMHAQAFVAIVRRSEDSFNALLERCVQHKLALEKLQYGVLPRAKQEGPFYCDQVELRIYRIQDKANKSDSEVAASGSC